MRTRRIESLTLPPATSWLERELALQWSAKLRRTWETYEVAGFEDERERIIAEAANCYASESAVYVSANRHRYVIPGKGIPGGADLGALYLKTCLRLAGVESIQPGAMEIPPAPEGELPLPAYCGGPFEGDMAIVDIQRCYWSILRNLHLDSHFYGEQIYAQEGIPFTYTGLLGLNKNLRNSIYGLTRKESITQHYRCGILQEPAPSAFYNPWLARIIAIIMQGIAWEARELFGSELKAWLTDAAILGRRSAPHFSEWVAGRWGMTPRLEGAGWGQLWSYGNYSIEGLRKGYPTVGGEQVDNLSDQYLELAHSFSRQKFPAKTEWPKSRTLKAAKAEWHRDITVSI